MMASISSEASSVYLSMSGSSTNLAAPLTTTTKQQRRMTSPALPSHSNSLNPVRLYSTKYYFHCELSTDVSHRQYKDTSVRRLHFATVISQIIPSLVSMTV